MDQQKTDRPRPELVRTDDKLGQVTYLQRRMSPAERLQVSEEEYLEHERTSKNKHEYMGGQVRAMAGASPRHNLIAANLVRTLGTLVRGRPCMVFTSDQRVHVPATRLYSYPDASVVCGRAEFHREDPITLVNPLFIAEVLSDSTQAYDRGPKFEYYRHLGSLAEYLMVAQLVRRVEHYRRLETGQWLLTLVEGSGTIELPALGGSIVLSDVYDKVELLS